MVEYDQKKDKEFYNEFARKIVLQWERWTLSRFVKGGGNEVRVVFRMDEFF